MPKKLTTEQFVEKAIKVHGERYDYSLVEYISNKVMVQIICPLHGIFEQRPDGHLSSIVGGCPECGRIQVIQTKKDHGLSHTVEYQTWHRMMSRCYNKNHHHYLDYGARGIMVCERWHDFLNFLEDMGLRPVNLSLDRIDCNGNYCPENCRWSSNKEQLNNRRNVKKYTVNGMTKTLTGWCEETGLSYKCLSNRFRNGWSIEDAINTPKITYNKKDGNEVKKKKSSSKEVIIIKEKTLEDFKNKCNFKDISGKKIGTLTAIKPLGINCYGQVVWLFTCECGDKINYICRGRLCERCNSPRFAKITNPKEYGTWCRMIERCKNDIDYINKNVTVCPRWLDGFDNFLADMGMSPHYKCSLDRINNNLGYYKGNCRWATDEQQQRNKSDTIMLTVNGETKPLVEWCEITGMSRSCLRSRIQSGWSVEDAVLTPFRKIKRKNPV